MHKSHIICIRLTSKCTECTSIDVQIVLLYSGSQAYRKLHTLVCINTKRERVEIVFSFDFNIDSHYFFIPQVI
jgi:hypothetical protein